MATSPQPGKQCVPPWANAMEFADNKTFECLKCGNVLINIVCPTCGCDNTIDRQLRATTWDEGARPNYRKEPEVGGELVNACLDSQSESDGDESGSEFEFNESDKSRVRRVKCDESESEFDESDDDSALGVRRHGAKKRGKRAPKRSTGGANKRRKNTHHWRQVDCTDANNKEHRKGHMNGSVMQLVAQPDAVRDLLQKTPYLEKGLEESEFEPQKIRQHFHLLLLKIGAQKGTNASLKKYPLYVMKLLELKSELRCKGDFFPENEKVAQRVCKLLSKKDAEDALKNKNKVLTTPAWRRQKHYMCAFNKYCELIRLEREGTLVPNKM